LLICTFVNNVTYFTYLLTMLEFGLRLGLRLRLGLGLELASRLGLVRIVDFRNSGP